MRLIACPDCHTQYDVSNVVAATLDCRCGRKLQNQHFEMVESRVYRCGSCAAQVASDAESCAYCGAHIVRDDRKLSLICPECFGRNADDARFCAACGTTFSPESVEIAGVELPCPVCGCLMAVRGLVGIAINECAQCNGIWVPGCEISALIDRAVEARDRVEAGGLERPAPRVNGANPYQQRVRYRKCPVCEAFMLRRNFRKTSGIIVDRCHEHGSWLDADELEGIAGFITEKAEKAEIAEKQGD